MIKYGCFDIPNTDFHFMDMKNKFITHFIKNVLDCEGNFQTWIHVDVSSKNVNRVNTVVFLCSLEASRHHSSCQAQ